MNIDRITKAIEDDAGEPIEGLSDSLAEMKAGKIAREYTPEQLLLQSARKVLKLSQPKFAALIETPVATVRDWEQGRFKPAGSALVLCKLAIKNPRALLSVSQVSKEWPYLSLTNSHFNPKLGVQKDLGSGLIVGMMINQTLPMLKWVVKKMMRLECASDCQNYGCRLANLTMDYIHNTMPATNLVSRQRECKIRVGKC